MKPTRILEMFLDANNRKMTVSDCQGEITMNEAENLIDQYIEGKVPDAFKKHMFKKKDKKGRQEVQGN